MLWKKSFQWLLVVCLSVFTKLCRIRAGPMCPAHHSSPRANKCCMESVMWKSWRRVLQLLRAAHRKREEKEWLSQMFCLQLLIRLYYDSDNTDAAARVQLSVCWICVHWSWAHPALSRITLSPVSAKCKTSPDLKTNISTCRDVLRAPQYVRAPLCPSDTWLWCTQCLWRASDGSCKYLALSNQSDDSSCDVNGIY